MRLPTRSSALGRTLATTATSAPAPRPPVLSGSSAAGPPPAELTPAAQPPPKRRPRAALRLAVVAALAGGLLLAWAGGAAAHPLGNFTINQYTGLRLLPDRVRVDYVLDMAEIPAFQTRQQVDRDGDGQVSAAEAAAWRQASCPRLAAGLALRLEGRRLALTTAASRLGFPVGAGGLPTLRLECTLETANTPLAGAGASGRASTLTFAGGNYADRVGWREVVAVGDGVTLTSSDVPSTSASARLTSYPRDQLRSPPDQRSASISLRPGAGARAGTASGAPAGTEGGRRAAVPVAVDRATRSFTELVARQRLDPAFGALAVALALLLGAVHALSPGHGKTVMAAYLLGLRSSLSQAMLVASTVTVTHTAGILVLGVALSVSTVLAPEQIYPWLGLASGLLLASVGLGLLRRALRAARHRHQHSGHDHGAHGHDHGGPAGHGPPHGHDHGGHGHDHPHAHAEGRPPGWRGLVSMGFAGGLVPSPSALVVLLGAIALGRAWFGVLLVVAYGAGMALTLTGAGVLLVRARAALDRRAGARAGGRSGLAPLARALPLASAAAITVVGLFLAVQGATAI